MSRANKARLQLILGKVGGGALEGGWVVRVDGGIPGQGKVRSSLYPELGVEEDPAPCLAPRLPCTLLLG